MARFRFRWECGGPLPLISAFRFSVPLASRLWLFAMVCAVALSWGGVASAQEPDPGERGDGEETAREKVAAEDGLSTIEEIVVSARKRDEFLEDRCDETQSCPRFQFELHEPPFVQPVFEDHSRDPCQESDD